MNCATPASCAFLVTVTAVLATAIAPHVSAARAAGEGAPPERVEFASADGKTTLVGYLFRPADGAGARAPAVVMMHGRAGAYSRRANGVYDATTLSLRHRFWGRFWAEQGYLAVLADGFGPRGYPQGLGRFSDATRPPELNEVTVRPLDAYGALKYLRARPDVLADRIALQGWSNGASATLASMAPDAPGIAEPTPTTGFRAALAFYPACGLKDHFAGAQYRSYAPLRVFVGTADEEISPRVCRALLEDAAGDVKIRFYKGATHSFDDPGRARQAVGANMEARLDAIEQARRFFARELAR